MNGKAKCFASARAMVPFPLAAGPSTAITGALFFFEFEAISAAKRAALTGAYAYGKARRRTPGTSRRHAFLLELRPSW